MYDYRGVIQQTMEELNEISVKGADNCRRLSTAVYTLGAVLEGMNAEREAEHNALLKKAGGKPKDETTEEKEGK